MDYLNIPYLLLWLNIRLCLPLTVLVICLCFVVRMDNSPVVYMNLLLANLIQFGMMIIWVARRDEIEIPFISRVIYYCGVMASLGFRICIALERCSVITRSRPQGSRQPMSYVLICFVMWGLCSAAVPLLRVYEHFLPIFILVVFIGTVLSAPVTVFCLAETVKSLPAAVWVSTEEKRRAVGVLVLLLIDYTEIVLSSDIWSVLMNVCFFFHPSYFQVIVHTFLLAPFMDVMLFAFMCEGPADKLLAYLCRCMTDNTAESVTEETQQRE